MKNLLGILLSAAVLTVACQKEDDIQEKIPEPEPAEEISTTITIDPTVTFQTIDGFGFFGAKSVWWDSNPSNLYSDDWAEMAINDLGITLWRNEYYPPSIAGQNQDADWEKQKPVVEGLAKIADENNVPLKFIFTVWSPPADLKCALDEENEPISGTPHSGGTKKGGTLDPAKYTEFGNWLADGIQLYKDSGIDIYAIGPQNEPFFKQTFNSCFYKPQEWYGAMLKNAMPVVKARFPEVKIFGSENMLGIEAGKDRQWFYHENLMNDEEALAQLDIWAVHGYVEGVTATASSELVNLWQVAKEEHMDPSSKPVWMTETSGYTNNWKGNANTKPGALDLAMDIHSSLYHGTASAWVWWQGSQMEQNEFNLMEGTESKGKKYYISKHFYRFIRPGAKMVKLDYNVEDGVHASAYKHEVMGAFTVVFINTSNKQLYVTLDGAGIPDTFDFYQTTSTISDNCTKIATVPKDSVTLPPSSIVTIVNGNIYE